MLTEHGSVLEPVVIISLIISVLPQSSVTCPEIINSLAKPLVIKELEFEPFTCSGKP